MRWKGGPIPAESAQRESVGSLPALTRVSLRMAGRRAVRGGVAVIPERRRSAGRQIEEGCRGGGPRGGTGRGVLRGDAGGERSWPWWSTGEAV